MPHDRARLPAALGIALAALIAVPAQAQDQRNLIAEAQAARAAGDNARSLDLLEQARAQSPQDPTVLRLLGSAYAFEHRYPQAIATLRQARKLAPRDQDIALALARAYLWSGNATAADNIAGEIAREDLGNVELPGLRRSIVRADRPARAPRHLATISFAQAISTVQVGGGNRTWYESVGALAVPVATGTTLSGQIDRESRAGPVDTRLELRLDQRIGKSGNIWIAAATTPHADFRELWSVSGGGETAINGAISLTFDLRYAEYSTTSVVVATPGLRLHTAEDRLSLAVRQISLWADNDHYRAGWSLRGEAQAAPHLRLVAGGATYPDTEAGVTRQVHSGFAGAILDIGDRLTLRATYEHENRNQSYTRDSAILAASWRF